MTKLLINLFVKNSNQTESKEVRASYGKLASFVGIVCNLLLFVIKLTVGTLSGSVSTTADAVNNLSDASSSIISLLGFKLASKPADADHPYGHARYEYLSGLMVALLIMVIGVELLKGSVEKIFSPSPVAFSWISAFVLAVSVLIKLWMALFNRAIGKRINSKTLFATAADSRNDVITTLAGVIAMIVSHYTSFELDGYVGVAVALFILYSGFGLVRETLDPILGRAPDPEFVEEIRKNIMSHTGILGTHDLMVHDYGPGNQFASVHVEVAAEEDVIEMHDLIDNIERSFLETYGLHMVIHMDPIVTADDKINDIRHKLIAEVAKIDSALSIHDLRAVVGPTHTNLVFDCVVPHCFKMSNAELRERISSAAKEIDESYNCVITIESSFASLPRE
ncbi:MAG: cation transporter [Clostridia bacterium]|nr:cation transporter [Clostridia bacterium]